MKAAETIEDNNAVKKKELRQSWMGEEKELWKSKRMYKQSVKETPETTDEKETWNWLRKCDLKRKRCYVLRRNRQTGNSNKLCKIQDR